MQTKNGYINYEAMTGKEAADAVTKQIAELIEKDVLELTGVMKNPDEKYYNHMKRAFKMVFEMQQSKITQLENKLR